MQTRFDILINGAGLTGLAAACLFTRDGFRVGIIDSRPADDGEDDRVIAVSLASVALMKRLEIWRDLPAEKVCAYREMRVRDANSAAKITFSAADIGQPCLGYIVHTSALRRAMSDKLRQNYRATILQECEAGAVQNDADGARVQLQGADKSEVRARLLIGADGAASKVRELCGIALQQTELGQDAIACRVQIGGQHDACARQCFLHTGPVAMLPLANGDCALVWSCDRDFADAMMALSDAEFCARLHAIFGRELGAVQALGARLRFPLAQHHAARYIADSVALIGDAAHRVHPLAGLGANLGFLDATALAEAVCDARARGRDFGKQSVLRRYERRRRGDNALALTAMLGLKNLFGSELPGAAMVRGCGVNLVDSVGPAKGVLAKYAGGVLNF